MSLAGTASLIVAAFELSSVRLIRGAMLAADLASGRGLPASGLGPAPNPRFEPRRHIEPEPVYEPRRHIEPTPRYDDRVVIYTVRYERSIEQQDDACAAVGEVASADAPRHRTPFPPVWQTLPPVEAESPARRPVKVVRHHPDIRHRGILVDVHA